MSKTAAMLEDRGVIRVSGVDAAVFLQGLLTNDVERLAPREARYAALLTAPRQDPVRLDCGAHPRPGTLLSARLRRGAVGRTSPNGSASTNFGPKLRLPTRARIELLSRSGGMSLRPPTTAFSTLTHAIRAWAGGRSSRAKLQPPSGPSMSASMRACASRWVRPKVGSTSLMATPSRTTPILIFCMGSISRRAAMSARRSFHA